MPNHCENDLIVIGPKDDVERFVKESSIEDTSMGDDIHLDFNTAVPYPEKWEAMDGVQEEYDEETRRLCEEAASKMPEWASKEEVHGAVSAVNRERWTQETRPKNGYNAGGYEWCIENWGTKWNAYSTHSISVEPVDDSSKQFKISFDTAWAPPIPVVHAWAEKHPSLEISLHWYEAGCGFCGSLVLHGAEVLQETNGEYRGPRGG
jgi:hypothetical protein